MQIPRNDWLRYIEKLSKINQKAADLMTAWIDANGYDNVDAMVAYASGLTQKYGEAAAALAGQIYDEIAAASGASVPAAEAAEVFDQYYIDKAVRNKLNESPIEIPRLVGRMVKQAGADTTLKNARRDGAQFAWVPHGDTCAFCITLASRGWQYQSKNAIKNGHAEHIHSNCDCTYAVRFNDRDGIAGYDPQKYQEMYYGAEGRTPEERINSMRRAQYAENKDKINEQKRLAYDVRKNLNINIGGGIMQSEKYIMPEDKISKFLLKPGAKHSNGFFDVGYTEKDAIRLNKDIEDQFDMKKAYDIRDVGDGSRRFSIDVTLGINKKKNFRTVWQEDEGADKPRFITAHRED